MAPSGPTASNPGRALVTGVTGYIGSRLVPVLLDAGWEVSVLTRSASRVAKAPWRDQVDVIEADATDTASLARAMDGVDVAYYLLHSMDGKGDYRRRDRQMAYGFADAATEAGVRRIVYLGGVRPPGDLNDMSEHLASRAEVGEIFLASEVPAAVVQAAVILGTGSASFEMLRHLTTRLPAMITPKWLNNTIQPIAVDDVLAALTAAADLPPEHNRTFDIGGPDVLTYGDLMQAYAKTAGLRPRVIVTAPVLTPRLASLWVGLVTPVPTGVAQPLVGSLIHNAVCSEDDLATLRPELAGRLGVRDAIRLALRDPAGLDGEGANGGLPASVSWPTDPDWAGPQSWLHQVLGASGRRGQ
ncbi:NAD(P)H-binding protein [Janibacter sp. GXQ6167]|uniref:NAD(P)H-binding protein n=1 Tax=Janibacter sp. GXQ6167 TaxID=3240791 RepID=UPI0035234F83